MSDDDPPALTQTWAWVYRKAGHRLAWLIIEAVPCTVKRTAVAQALEDSGVDRRYSPGVGGTTAILPESRWGTLEGLDRADRLPWDKLIPPEKRLTLRMTGPEHARLARAARRRGQDLQGWALANLQVAASAELDESATPATPS